MELLKFPRSYLPFPWSLPLPPTVLVSLGVRARLGHSLCEPGLTWHWGTEALAPRGSEEEGLGRGLGTSSTTQNAARVGDRKKEKNNSPFTFFPQIDNVKVLAAKHLSPDPGYNLIGHFLPLLFPESFSFIHQPFHTFYSTCSDPSWELLSLVVYFVLKMSEDINILTYFLFSPLREL